MHWDGEVISWRLVESRASPEAEQGWLGIAWFCGKLAVHGIEVVTSLMDVIEDFRWTIQRIAVVCMSVSLLESRKFLPSTSLNIGLAAIPPPIFTARLTLHCRRINRWPNLQFVLLSVGCIMFILRFTIASWDSLVVDRFQSCYGSSQQCCPILTRENMRSSLPKMMTMRRL